MRLIREGIDMKGMDGASLNEGPRENEYNSRSNRLLRDYFCYVSDLVLGWSVQGRSMFRGSREIFY